MTDHERLGPPPVEPLSEAAWSRVERGLWSQREPMRASAPVSPGPRRWWIAAAPLAAIAIVGIVVAIRLQAPVIAVAVEPSRVVSGAAPVAMSLGDVHIELAADTAVVTGVEASHPVAMVERGAAWFTVAPRLQRPDVIVRAGDATIRVIGTRFHVARSGERTEVEVEHGLVEVQFRGAIVAVGASQRWSSEAPARVASAAPTVTAPASGPAETQVATPLPVRSEGDRSVPSRPRPRRTAVPNPPTTAPAPAPSTPASAAEPVDRAKLEYDRLAALEPSSPGAALTGYLALAEGTGPWAAPSLFAAGRLAVDRGDHRAKRLLERYLRRFPDGQNAADARQLLEHLQTP